MRIPWTIFLLIIIRMWPDLKGGDRCCFNWPSTSFWFFLHSAPAHFAPFVRDSIVLPRLLDLLIELTSRSADSVQKASSVLTRCPSFNMLLLRLNFC